MKFFINSIFSILCILLFSCLGNATEESKPTEEKPELKIEILKGPMGECLRKSKKTDLIFMRYTGYFENGTKFESTIDRLGLEPISFQLGVGQVIRGWEQGLLDMCVGEKRKLFVPSHLAYDKMGMGMIPPHTNLIFEAEIVKIEDGPPPRNVFKMLDINGDLHITVEEAALYLSHQAISQRIPDNIAVQQNKIRLEQLFTNDDKDKNGKVSFEEFSGPKQDPQLHDEL